MRVLLHTRFYPNMGGIETVAWLLAHEWQRLGEQVTGVSDVACAPAQRRELPFPVHYRPSIQCWLKLMRRADVFVHMNVSLKALWPLALVRRPWVVVHQGCYEVDRSGKRDWREKLKLKSMSFATNVAASCAIARRIARPAVVIPNPFDSTLFQTTSSVAKQCELAFVGRLVSDKGCDQLIQALELLRNEGLTPRLTIIGDGPERAALEQMVQAGQLTGQVRFTGGLDQRGVAEELRRHEIMVVPSLWEEPFGVVALEGAACGCVVLGSDGGGLPEAIGPAGRTFRRGDVNDLVLKLSHLLQHTEEWSRYRAAAKAHLAKHQPRAVAARYLEILRRAV